MPELPRILHVLRPGSEELDAHVLTLTAGLARHQNQPFAVGPLERRFREEFSHNGVRWANIPLPTTLAWRDQKRGADGLARFFRAANPVLIHAHGFQAALSSLLALRGVRPRLPLVCSPHGVPTLHGRSTGERILRRLGYRRVVRRCDAIIVASEAERKSLTERVGESCLARAGRIFVVPPGVERRRRSSVFDIGLKRRRAGLHQDASVVALLASLQEGLPLDDFLHAAALVSQELANVEFAIIGEGPRMEQLRTLAHDLGLSGNTVFLGHRLDALDIVATCNVFAAISGEAGGVANALEALARDVRVVADDVPSHREVFGGVAGVPIAPISDHQAFADAVRQQLEGISSEEDGIKATTDMAWGVDEVLASQDEFDLDKPGLDPRDRSHSVTSDIDHLLERHTIPQMVEGTLEVYAQLLDG